VAHKHLLRRFKEGVPSGLSSQTANKSLCADFDKDLHAAFRPGLAPLKYSVPFQKGAPFTMEEGAEQCDFDENCFSAPPGRRGRCRSTSSARPNPSL
jgi:hypothetical protein